jgi:geranylgeranyl diphosphate synthase type I
MFPQDTPFSRKLVVQRILKKFAEQTTSGLSNIELLSIMSYVQDYWKEPYRPALISLSCEAVGGNSGDVEDAGVVMSMLVAGMAIHDDIIDRSVKKHFNRKKTVFGAKGNEKALLVGDLLLLKGLISALEVFKNKMLIDKYDLVIKTLRDFIFEIYEGEFMEIHCRKNLDVNVDYQRQYLWKFTSDAGACAKIGSILGNGSVDEIESLFDFARMFAFNIFLREELQDSFNLEQNLVHRIKYESLPLTVIYSAKASKQAYTEIKKIIAKSKITPEDSVKLIYWGFKTGAYDYIYDLVKTNSEKALLRLVNLNQTQAKKELELMINQSLTEIQRIQKNNSFYQK